MIPNRGRAFGRHVRSLRKVRGLTQEVLAERSGLSADTIRRLEQGSFSPSLDTLNKLCEGLEIRLSTLFESFELGEINPSRELRDLLVDQPPEIVAKVTTIIRHLLDVLKAKKTPHVSAPGSMTKMKASRM